MRRETFKKKIMNLFELTELNREQKKAFAKLKRVYKECEKLKILFTNQYGSLFAYDKNKIRQFGDRTSGFPENETVPLGAAIGGDYLKIPNEWSDDQGMHLLHLTPKAMKSLMSDSISKSTEGFEEYL